MSNGFYEDEDKITFDEAEMFVDRYLRQHSKNKTVVDCTTVARRFDVEDSYHNLMRITEALKKRLEVQRESGSRAAQFKMP